MRRHAGHAGGGRRTYERSVSQCIVQSAIDVRSGAGSNVRVCVHDRLVSCSMSPVSLILRSSFRAQGRVMSREFKGTSFKVTSTATRPGYLTLQKKQARNWAHYCLVVRNCITRLVRGEFK